MSVFKTSESAELDKVSEVEGEIREFVRRDSRRFSAATRE